jgi:hypothetical protein
MIENTSLSTQWINTEGAQRIMRETGVTPDPPNVSELFSVARRDRKDYVWGVLFELALAVAKQSANPAATAQESADEHGYIPAEEPIHKWAKSSAQRLERILDGLL